MQIKILKCLSIPLQYFELPCVWEVIDKHALPVNTKYKSDIYYLLQLINSSLINIDID